MSTFTIILSLFAGAGILGVVYQALGCARDRSRFPPPGRVVSAGAVRLHLRDHGAGVPPVVFESGIGASSLSWGLVEDEVARFTRVVSYDRAGLAWSSPARSPRVPSCIVGELRALLRAVGVSGPYILVGHSFGTLVVRYHAARHPEEVAGLVLVDPIHPHDWLAPSPAQSRQLRGGVFLAGLGAWLARFGVVRFCLALATRGRPGGPLLFVRLFGPELVAALGRIVGQVRKLPPGALERVQSLWCLPKCHRALARYLGDLPRSATEVADAGDLHDVQLIVLSAGTHAAAARPQFESLARLSTRGRHRVAVRSGHWIQLDEPELVIAAVRELVESARNAAEVRG